MSFGSSARSLASVFRFLKTLAFIGRDAARVLHGLPDWWRLATRGRVDSSAEHAEIRAWLDRAAASRAAGRPDEAVALYRQVITRRRDHVGALRGLREVAVGARRWTDALAAAERLVAIAPGAERAAEAEWLTVTHYELGREDLAAARHDAALSHFRQAVRIDRHFVPAWVALGDAYEAAGDHREAVRVWERATDATASLPLLARLERVYRDEGRPSRMIARYRLAAERAPDDLGIASALGRVFFELEMLDEAADQFEKVEVRAPDLPVVHAFLGAVFERRGETREAFEEYRRALRLAQAFTWPHRCASCGALAPTWEDRCRACGRWNTSSPAGGR